MKLTKEDKELLKRHYTVLKIFGKEIMFFNTSPKQVLNHLKELNKNGVKLIKGQP